MNLKALPVVLWTLAIPASGGGPNYEAFSDRSGHILDDDQHVAAFQAMVHDARQLEAIHADAAQGNARAVRVFSELETIYFPSVGRKVAEEEGRPACLVPVYREISGTCIPNWGYLDYLSKGTRMGDRLRKAVGDAYAHRARELGIENRAITSAVNALLAVGVASAALREVPTGPRVPKLPEAPPAPEAEAVAGSSGRAANNLRRDPAAEGAHSTFKVGPQGQVTGHAEWEPNPKNPSGFDQIKRVDTQHANSHTHYDTGLI
jgi:hypothetical protein